MSGTSDIAAEYAGAYDYYVYAFQVASEQFYEELPELAGACEYAAQTILSLKEMGLELPAEFLIDKDRSEVVLAWDESAEERGKVVFRFTHDRMKSFAYAEDNSLVEYSVIDRYQNEEEYVD